MFIWLIIPLVNLIKHMVGVLVLSLRSVDGGDSQTKSITAKQPGCETADVFVTDQENQQRDYHDGNGETKVYKTKCHKCCHSGVRTRIMTIFTTTDETGTIRNE